VPLNFSEGHGFNCAVKAQPPGTLLSAEGRRTAALLRRRAFSQATSPLLILEDGHGRVPVLRGAAVGGPFKPSFGLSGAVPPLLRLNRWPKRFFICVSAVQFAFAFALLLSVNPR